MIKYPWNTDHRRFPTLLSMFLVPFLIHATDHTIDRVIFEELRNYYTAVVHSSCFSPRVFYDFFMLYDSSRFGRERERLTTSDVLNFLNHITGCY